MVDESKDSSSNEQLSAVVRFVLKESMKQNEKTSVHSFPNEYFIGLVMVTEFAAQSLASEIIRYLSFLKIDVDKYIALCFDG